jgi:type I restriction enzyme S subunit
MDVRPGYKLTEVGVIPENWEVKTFAQLFAFRNGVNADKRSYGRGLRFVNVLEPITYSHLYGPEIPGRVTLPDPVAASFAVRRGDVLFNRTSETQGEVGLAATYLGTDPVVFGGFVIRGRPTDQSLDPTYSGYALRAPFIRSQIVPMGQGAIRANIGQRNLGLVVAPVPPHAEQSSIAETLSDADALIESLEQLLAKKRQIKQGAVQELLTGRKRMAGFNGKSGYKQTETGEVPEDWEVKRVAEMGDVCAGKALAVRGVGPQRPYLRTKNVFDGRIDVGDVLQMPMTDAEFARYRLRHGDVLLNEGQSIELVGRSAMYRDEYPEPCAIQNQLVRFRARQGVSGSFAVHVFRHCQTSGIFSKIALQTTSVAHLGVSRFAKLPLPWPPSLAEQEAIARALDDADAVIDSLDQLLSKKQQIKQGMMQELLTGRIRLA